MPTEIEKRIKFSAHAGVLVERDMLETLKQVINYQSCGDQQFTVTTEELASYVNEVTGGGENPHNSLTRCEQFTKDVLAAVRGKAAEVNFYTT